MSRCRKYSFKGKKRRSDEDEDPLAESILSTLLNPSSASGHPAHQDESLEVRVASISAELAAAIAQAQRRVYDNDDEDEEEEDEEEADEDADDEVRGSTPAPRCTTPCIVHTQICL